MTEFRRFVYKFLSVSIRENPWLTQVPFLRKISVQQ
jgi:hypothetical protein